MYQSGQGIDINLATAADDYKAAKDQLPEAEDALAAFYEQGYPGQAADSQIAKRVYQDAANKNNAHAQFKIRKFALEHKQYGGASGLFHKAAAQDYAAAETELGLMSIKGISCSKVYVDARTWFMKPVAAGDTGAEYQVGQLYADGLGVPKDATLARKWIATAANGRDKPAQTWITIQPAI